MRAVGVLRFTLDLTSGSGVLVYLLVGLKVHCVVHTEDAQVHLSFPRLQG